MDLPDEILDEILSDLGSHEDLISFALASRACMRLVIPRHSEYRILRIRHPMPPMWAHLARRSDLARNVREVHICDRHDYSSPDHFPTTLIEKEPDEHPRNAEEWMRVINLCQALRHMNRLQVFTWSWNVDYPRPTAHRSHEDLIFGALRSKLSLKHLGIQGAFATHVRGYPDPESTVYPLWSISNLESLCLYGDNWVKLENAVHVGRMLERSPELEHIEIPLEIRQLTNLHFPQLRKLKLFLQSGATSLVDESRTRFLENHPTLEEISWFPIGSVSFSPNSLPSLRGLRTSRQVLQALEENSTITRPIECLDVQSIDAESLCNLNNLDRTSLRKLSLHVFGNFSSIHRLAATFPSITVLSLPTFHLPSDAIHPVPVRLDKWLDILPRFTNLEVFRGQGLWHAVQKRKDLMHVVIMRLVLLCPALKELDHCDFYEKRMAHKRIVIIRDGDEIKYAVRKPLPRDCFDVMDGAFD